MRYTEKEMKAFIDKAPDFLLYKEEIKKSMALLPSGVRFKLPTANTDWCADLFKVLLFLCYEYKNTFFITSDVDDLPGFIYLYIQ